MKTARKSIWTSIHGPFGDPGSNHLAGLFGQFKLDRSPRFLLHYKGALFDTVPGDNITEPQGHQIVTAEFAVDGEVEQGQVPWLAV